jgi:hypothetical protein
MGLYTRGVYPEISYQERKENTLFARTYDAFINMLRLRDQSEGKIPIRISNETEQRSMSWFLS